MIHLFLLFLKVYSNNSDLVLVLYSDNTSEDLVLQFKDYLNKIHIKSFNFSSVDEVSLIVDITEDQMRLYEIEAVSEYLKVPYLTISKTSETSYSRFRYSAIPSQLYESKKINELLNILQWTSVSVLSSGDPTAISFSNNLKNSLNISNTIWITQEINDLNQINKLVKQKIKSSSEKNFIILGSSNFLRNFQTVLVERKGNKPSLNFLYPSLVSTEAFVENSLIVSMRGTSSTKNRSELIFHYIKNLVNQFFSNSQKSFSFCDSHNCGNQLDLLQVQNSTRVKVASIDREIVLNGSVLIRENSNNSLGMSEIRLFVANGSWEANPVLRTDSNLFFQGAFYAINKTNNMPDLKGFKYAVQPTDCGNLQVDLNYSYECLKRLADGRTVAYLTSLYHAGIYANIFSLRRLGLYIPHISAMISDDSLRNKTEFPELLTLASGYSDYYIGGLSLIFKNFKWNKVIVFGSEDLMFIYTMLTPLLIKSGFEVLNPSHLAIFPANYTRADFEKYKEYFLFPRKKRCRAFIIIGSQIGYYMEGLYDVGYRKGEFVTAWQLFTFNAFMAYETNDVYLNKVKELLEGNLVSSFHEWEGNLGKQVFNDLKKSFEDPSNMCMTHDAFMLIHSSIKHLITKGEDFEDPITLLQFMRLQRFQGCLGPVYFSPDSNERSGVRYMFKQITWNQESGKLELFDLVLADRYSLRTTVYVNKPKWVESDSTPSNFFDYGICEFNPKLIRDSQEGRKVMIVVGIILIFNSGFFSFISWKNFQAPTPEFQDDKMISVSDMVNLGFFVLEFFQIICLEPEDGVFSKTLNDFNKLIGFNIQEYFNIEYENFWNFYNGLLAINFAFVLMSALILIRYTKVGYCLNEQVLKIFEMLGTLIGHLFFLPIIYLSLDIFNCSNGIGEDLDSSFLSRDCRHFCYTGRHKGYVIAGGIALALFTAVGSYVRPLWEDLQNESNIRTKISYFCSLNTFQVAFVVVKRAGQMQYRVVFGFILTGLVMAFIVLTALVKPFNLEKAWVYQITFLSMSAWGVLISTFYVWTDGNFVFYIVCYFGILLILVLGVFYSYRFKKTFKTTRGVKVSSLIKFQFSTDFRHLIQDSVFKDGGEVNFKFSG